MIRYSIRKSARAKHLHLKVSASDGLVVILPPAFDTSKIPGILREERVWIENALLKVAAQQDTLLSGIARSDAPHALPVRIFLQAVNQEWTVTYRKAPVPWCAAISRRPRRIEVCGTIDDHSACRAALHRWIHRRAHAHLVPWLQETSNEIGRPYGRTRVGNQRTRWGSYSQTGTISINQKLLFIPTDLVRYVFLHELCHTVHADHSPRFWTLLRAKEPRSAALQRELRIAWKHIPAWANAGLHSL